MRVRSMTSRRVGAALVWILVSVPALAAAQDEPFVADFESGDLSSQFRLETCCEHSARYVSDPVRAGGRAVRMEVRRTDPDVSNSKRSELVPRRPVGTGARYDIMEQEYWYGFSILLPDDWVVDPRSSDIIAQWHEQPDTHLGESYRSPPLSIIVRGDALFVEQRWDPKPLTRGNDPRPEGDVVQYPIGTIARGAWMTWVVHVRWSHTDAGLTEVWRDGALVHRRVGPNQYNDVRGPYFKLGVYKWDWRSNPTRSIADVRVVYLDELRILGADGSFEAVSPPGAATPEPAAFRAYPMPGCDAVIPVRVDASTHEASSPPWATLDGDLSTRWSGSGDGAWIEYALDHPTRIGAVGVAFHRGDERWAELAVEAVDASGAIEPWRARTRTDGASLEPARFDLDPREVSRVRLVGHGNRDNAWNSLTEVILCRARAEEPIDPDAGPPARDGGGPARAGDAGAPRDAQASVDGGGARAAGGCRATPGSGSHLPLALGVVWLWYRRRQAA